MATPPNWIHIGLAKTGTTSLQQVLFSRHPDVIYLGKVWSSDEALLKVMSDASRARDHHLPEGWLDRLAKPEVARAVAAGAAGKKLVMFSEEDLTTHRFIDPAVAARRMHAPLPSARILVVLRDPMDWLQSMYFFRLSLRFPEALDGFDAWLAQGVARPPRGTDFGQLRVAETLETYAGLFGAENIVIRFYEDLHRDAEGFVTELSAALGIDPAAALAAYNSGGEGRFGKSRVTVARSEFLLSFRQVRDGQAAAYRAGLQPMLNALEAPQLKRVEAMLDTALASPEAERVKAMRDASAFLDRVLRDRLDTGGRATAEASAETRRAVRDIVAPGLDAIARRFGAPADRYLDAAWARRPDQARPRAVPGSWR